MTPGPKHNTWAELCVKHSCLSQHCWDCLTSPRRPFAGNVLLFFRGGGVLLTNSAAWMYRNCEQRIAMSSQKSIPRRSSTLETSSTVEKCWSAESPLCLFYPSDSHYYSHPQWCGAPSASKSNLGARKATLFCLCLSVFVLNSCARWP